MHMQGLNDVYLILQGFLMHTLCSISHCACGCAPICFRTYVVQYRICACRHAPWSFLLGPTKSSILLAVCPLQNQAAVQKPIPRKMFPMDPARLGRSCHCRGYPPHLCRRQQPQQRQRAGPLQIMAPEGTAASRGLRAYNHPGSLLAATRGEPLRYRSTELYTGVWFHLNVSH